MTTETVHLNGNTFSQKYQERNRNCLGVKSSDGDDDDDNGAKGAERFIYGLNLFPNWAYYANVLERGAKEFWSLLLLWTLAGLDWGFVLVAFSGILRILLFKEIFCCF